MLLVILGAGASFDCAPLYPATNVGPDENRMPLANYLFANTRHCKDAWTEFSECKPIVPRLTNLHYSTGDSIESRLQTILEESERGDINRQQQLIATRYYIHNVISSYQESTTTNLLHGISSYVGLIDAIRHRRGSNGKICFVSFNYDTLLEEALAQFGVSYKESLMSYISHPLWKLIKPHGSINWSRKFSLVLPDSDRMWNQTIYHEIIRNAPNINLGDTYVLGQDVYNRPTEFSVPSIAVPFKNKDEFECPQKHVDYLEDELKSVTGVLIVGWRATETKFLELLARHVPKDLNWLIVNPVHQDAQTVITRLNKLGISGGFSQYGGGFSNFVGNNAGDTLFYEALKNA